MQRVSGKGSKRAGGQAAGGASVAAPPAGRKGVGRGRVASSTEAASSRNSWLILAGLVVLHLVLALLSFDPTPHTGGDNAAYISLARSLLERGTYQELYDPGLRPHTIYPPGFPGVLAFAMLLGITSWVGLKLVVVTLSGLAVAATYLWLRQRSGPWLAFGATLVVAVSPKIVELSHWVLSDTPFWAFTALALWAYSGIEEGRRGAVALAVATTVLAYFTRSAGLPLVLAAGGWLLWRRRWRELAILAVVLAPLALWWWLRAQGQGGVEYVSQFWSVDPYNPELGRIGVADLIGRVGDNLMNYGKVHLPLLLVGQVGKPVIALGVVVALAAVVGWGLRLRRPGVTEFFFPLYLGLILVWPAVWSGERFLLPAYPLLIGYAAEALVYLVRRVWGGAVVPVGVAAVALIVALSVPAISYGVKWGSTCTTLYRAGDRYPCLDPVWRDFFTIAEWARAELPEDGVVISRKPRLFYGLSERRGLIYPFSRNPEDFFATVRESGARYLVIDQLGATSARYLGPVFRSHAGAFCMLHEAPQGYAALLGILPESEWRVDAGAGGFPACPDSYRRLP